MLSRMFFAILFALVLFRMDGIAEFFPLTNTVDGNQNIGEWTLMVMVFIGLFEAMRLNHRSLKIEVMRKRQQKDRERENNKTVG